MILLIAGAPLLVAVVVVVIVIVVKKYVVYLGLLNCISATMSRFSGEVGRGYRYTIKNKAWVH